MPKIRITSKMQTDSGLRLLHGRNELDPVYRYLKGLEVWSIGPSTTFSDEL